MIITEILDRPEGAEEHSLGLQAKVKNAEFMAA